MESKENERAAQMERCRENSPAGPATAEHGTAEHGTAERETAEHGTAEHEASHRAEPDSDRTGNQRRLEAALESAPGGVWDFDVTRNIAHRTEAFFRMLGDAPELESIDLGAWRERIHPDDVSRVQAAAGAVIEGRQSSYEAEYRYRHADGSWRWLLDRGRATDWDAQGRATRMVGFVVDVTTRKLAEQALLESETVLRAVTANTPDWLFLVDEALVIRFVNRQFGAHTAEQMVSRPLLDFIPGAHRARLMDLYLTVLVSGTPGRIEVRHAGEDGTVSHHEHRVVPVVERGTVRSLTVAVTDVTDRKRAESALRESKDAMHTQVRILETLQEGVVLLDAATAVVKLTNPMFARMFGYDSKEALMGRSVEPLFSTRALQRSRAGRPLDDTGSHAGVLSVELECVRKDGTRFVAACLLTPIQIGGIDHWLAVFNDVTERKRLEREIIQISNREQQRIGSDLHDGLGQELTGIALMLKGVVAQLRKEGSSASLDVEEVVGLVNNAIEGTRTLARGLSPVSGERGGLKPALGALAAQASDRYGVQVLFESDLDDSVPVNDAAATHIYRIVQEALTNVVRHSEASKVAIRLRGAGDDVHLSVEDNGRGFPQPVPERCGGPAPQSSGGLGLKIMRYRARMLGGDLMIEPGANGGASIHCVFPAAMPGEGARQRDPDTGES